LPKFSTIHENAIIRKGGEKELNSLLSPVKSSKTLTRITDDRYLAEMTRCIFQAGFVWRVVNQKWDDFETAFFGFEPQKMVRLSPDQLDSLGKDKRIIRNMQKILSVPQNAQFILDEAQKHGSFSQMVANWPTSELNALFLRLKKSGARLGGMTGPRMLRSMGKDAYLLTPDVVHALRNAGLEISKTPGSQRDLTTIQNTFNQWHQDTALPYTHLSKICSYSVGENYSVEQLNEFNTSA